MNMKNKEIEIKLLLNDADKIPQLKKYLMNIAAKTSLNRLQKTHMQAVYYDTPDGFLRSRRIAYRVRQENNNIVATYKSSISEKEGVFTRLEINKNVQSLQPDIGIFAAESSVQGALRGALNKEFISIVKTDFVRESIIADWHGSLIEAAVDIGCVSGKNGSLPICELELELKYGDEEALLDLKTALAKLFPLKTSTVSKYHQGLILAGLA